MAKSQGRIETVTIEKRSATGSTKVNHVRKTGKVPGVLYGHGEPTPIAIAAKALDDLIHSGGRSHVVDASVDGKHDSVLLRNVQRDPITRRPLHVDFQRVSKGEAVNASIAIVTLGVSRGVKDSGAVMDVVTRQIEVKGPADKIPEQITIDVSEMDVNEHVSASDVALPAGFTLITPPDTVLVSIEASRTAQQAEAADTAAAAAAPVEPAAPASTPAT